MGCLCVELHAVKGKKLVMFMQTAVEVAHLWIPYQKNICVHGSARENITAITLHFELAQYEKSHSYIITQEWRLDAISLDSNSYLTIKGP